MSKYLANRKCSVCGALLDYNFAVSHGREENGDIRITVANFGYEAPDCHRIQVRATVPESMSDKHFDIIAALQKAAIDILKPTRYDQDRPDVTITTQLDINSAMHYLVNNGTWTDYDMESFWHYIATHTDANVTLNGTAIQNHTEEWLESKDTPDNIKKLCCNFIQEFGNPTFFYCWF